MSEHEDTEEQIAIIEFVKSGKGHLLIEALAGSGKTSTAIRSLRVLPQKSALMCAFNKKIADELTERMGKAPPGSLWLAATFHSLGLKILRKHRPLEVRPEATEDLVNDAAEAYEANAIAGNDRHYKVGFDVRRIAVRLLRTVKETCVDREISATKVRVVGEEHNALGKLREEDRSKVSEIVRHAYQLGLDLKARRAIDFCDMVWLPVVLDLAPASRYQFVFVDEAQDLSLPQLKLVKKLVAPSGRLVVVGDLHQAIYGWRGAAGDEVWRELREAYHASQLPLTMTFRCSKAVVREANQLVPTLRPRADAPGGSVKGCTFEQLPELLKKTWKTETFVLSRNNADLLHTALYLIKADVGFKMLAGKELIEPLFEILDRLDKSTREAFTRDLGDWYQKESDKAARVHAAAWAERIEQQYQSFLTLLSYAEPSRFKSILNDLVNTGGMSNTTLSTVHKVKGLEAERVFLLRQTFTRQALRDAIEMAVDDHERDRARERLANIKQEELNLEYVAITRAKLDLVWVDMRGVSTTSLAKLWEQKNVEPKPKSETEKRFSNIDLDGN